MLAMKFIKLFLFVLLFQSQSYAQVQNWVLGTGFNFVDDDGKASSLFNLKNGWNGLPFPSSFYCEKYFNKSDPAYNPNWESYLYQTDTTMRSLIVNLPIVAL